MPQYIKFSNEEIEQANCADIKSLLERNGETLKRSGSEWEWKCQGKKITVRANKWFDQYERIGGGAIRFVMNFYGVSFQEAVLQLLDRRVAPQIIVEIPQEKKPFLLPEPYENMRRVFAYLTQHRQINRDIISHFAKIGLLYEEANHHNAVFVGKDESEQPRHAHKVGTYTKGEQHYRGNVPSSDPKYSFHYIGTSDKLYIFEAPIDMLSYITLHPQHWQAHNYVALCSVADIAAKHLLETYHHIGRAVVCTDHDKAGAAAYERMRDSLRCAVTREVSKHKDWNEDLKALNGLTPIPAIDVEEDKINLGGIAL